MEKPSERAESKFLDQIDDDTSSFFIRTYCSRLLLVAFSSIKNRKSSFYGGGDSPFFFFEPTNKSPPRDSDLPPCYHGSIVFLPGYMLTSLFFPHNALQTRASLLFRGSKTTSQSDFETRPCAPCLPLSPPPSIDWNFSFCPSRGASPPSSFQTTCRHSSLTALRQHFSIQ